MDSKHSAAARLRAAGVNLAVLLTAVVFALAAGETGLRVAGVHVPSVDGRERWIADARLLYRGDPALPEHDSRGFRNPDALERADFVLLGDSHTYGSHVSPNDTWARVLAAETGSTVYNMAFPGWGPLQAAFVLPDALALKPKTVIYGFFFGNDVLNALGHDPPDVRSGRPPPSAHAMPCAEYRRRPAGVRAFVSRHSRMYGLVRNLYRTVVPLPDMNADVEGARREAESDPHDEATFFEGAQWRTVLTAPYLFCALDDSDPRIRAGVEIAKSTLLAMARDADDAGSVFAVVLLPTKESVFAPRVADVGAHEGLAGLFAAESRLRVDLAAVLGAAGVPVLDLLPPLRGAPEQPYPVGRDGHPNVTGHRVIGLEVARFVRDVALRNVPADGSETSVEAAVPADGERTHADAVAGVRGRDAPRAGLPGGRRLGTVRKCPLTCRDRNGAAPRAPRASARP